MVSIKIGKSIHLDLDRALETRILIQANSGGGKSWLIRRLLEQTHKHVQQIILDLEGEFSTLRELYDYILVSDEGDLPVELKSAKLLAHKLLGLNVSAIIDLYELKPSQRLSYVRKFLDAMINSPKKLWHPCMVIVDEANHLCPQKGNAESAESVISLAQRGRKRGLCAVVATQRLSMLSKSCAAELNNKLIGRTGLDVDRKRASEELGFTSKEQSLALRTLEPGEFYAFGPAISSEVVKVMVGGVKSSHPRLGKRLALKPTPPTDRIKRVLSKLTDLPQEALKEATTVAELKKQNTDLRRRVTLAEKKTGVPDQNTIDRSVERAVSKAIAGERKIYQRATDSRNKDIMVIINHEVRDLVKIINDISAKVYVGLEKITKKDSELISKPIRRIELPETGRIIPSMNLGPKRREECLVTNGDERLRAGAIRMLTALVQRYPDPLTRAQLSVLSDVKMTGGTFSTYLGNLKTTEFIFEQNKTIWATESGVDYFAGAIPEMKSRDEIIAMWMSKLRAGARRMLQVCIDAWPESISREVLSYEANVKSSGGTFSTYLGNLKSCNLVVESGREIKATNELMQGE